MQPPFRIAESYIVEPSLNRVTGPRGVNRLEPKVMVVLVCLAERAGQMVPKNRLLQAAWPDTAVTDDVLTRAISELRRLFEDDPKQPHTIETIAKSGYRLIAPVGVVAPHVGPLWSAAGELVPDSVAAAATAAASAGQSLLQPSRRAVLGAVGAAAVVLLALAGAWQLRGRPTTPVTPVPAMRVVALTAMSGSEYGASFSPDGRQVAFGWNGENANPGTRAWWEGDWDIYVKLVGSSEVRQVTTGPGVDQKTNRTKYMHDQLLRQPFANGLIPASRIHAFSRAGVEALPLPNSGGNTFVNASGLLRQTNNNYSGRADFVASTKWNLFGRYSISPENSVIPQAIPNRDGRNDARSQNATAGSTYVLRPNLLNETRLAVSRLHVLTGFEDPLFDVNGQRTVLPQFNVAGYPLFGGAGQFAATTGGGLLRVRNTTFQVYNNLAWTKGRHVLKFGGEALQVRYSRIETPSTLGNFQFTQGFTTRTARTDGTGHALASFLLALPAVSNRSVGPNRADAMQNILSGYVQDDIKLRSNVTLNLGLRYEFAPPMYDINGQFSSIDYSTAPTPAQAFAERKTGVNKATLFVCGQSGYPRGCAFTDKNNFSPRAGIVWGLSPKTVFKAGGGVFYANTDVNPLFRLAAGLPTNVSQALTSDNFIPQYRGYDIFGRPSVGPLQLQAAGIDLLQRTSYSLQWNASIQQQIARDIVVEVGYLATAGLKLEQNVQPNNALPGTGAVDPRRPYFGANFAPGTQFPAYLDVIGNSVPLGFINFLPHSAQSNYHSGYVRFEKRFNKGLSVLSSYTWAKSITNAPQFRNAGGVNGSENSPAQDSFNLAAERGLASFHLSHRLVSTFLYDLPFGKGTKYLTHGIGSKILGGWQTSAIYQLQSGFPFTLNLRGDTAGVGAGTGGIFVRPNAVSGATSALDGSLRSTAKWFNTGAFISPPAAAFGNVGRNTVIGPGLSNLDMVVVKNVPVSEAFKLQFRFEVFNLANNANYNVVGRIVNDPTYGQVLSQFDPRQIQLGIKALF